MQGPKRPRITEEARDEDDDIPPAPGLIFDSDEAEESNNHQSEPEAAAPEPGPSRGAVEKFITFESCIATG